MNTALQPSTAGEFDAVLRGPSTSSSSSRELNWKGYVTERHLAGAGERPEAISDRHVICLWHNDLTICEYSRGYRNFVPSSKRRNSLSIIPQGIVPAIRVEGQVDTTLCALEPDFVQGVGMELDQKPTVELFYQTGLMDSALSGLMRLLSLEASQGGASGPLYADQLANALAIRVFFSVREEKSKRESRKVSPLPRHCQRRVLERMQNLQANLDLQTLAAESGYSRTHFLLMFRESMGCSPHRYLMGLRLERAQELLRQKKMSLIDIAAMCGFANHSHLSRIFRQNVGMSPSEYRRNL